MRRFRINRSGVVAELARSDLDTIDAARNYITRRLGREIARVDRAMESDTAEYEGGASPGEDYLLELGATGHLLDELWIIALWKCVELNTRRWIEVALGEPHGQAVFKWKALKRRIVTALGIELDRVKSYRSIDELRCINNAIKHQGRIGEELRAFRAWKRRDELIELDRAYDRLLPRVRSYLGDLGSRFVRMEERAARRSR